MRHCSRVLWCLATVAAACCLWSGAASAQTATPKQRHRSPRGSHRAASLCRHRPSKSNRPRTMLPRSDCCSSRTTGRCGCASMAAANDPNQVKLGQVSYTALPDPEPKTIRKHDLITIVIHEESEFKSQGDAALKERVGLRRSAECLGPAQHRPPHAVTDCDGVRWRGHTRSQDDRDAEFHRRRYRQPHRHPHRPYHRRSRGHQAQRHSSSRPANSFAPTRKNSNSSSPAPAGPKTSLRITPS